MLFILPSLPFGHLSQRERKTKRLIKYTVSPFGRDGVAREGYFLLKLFAFFKFSKFGRIIDDKMINTPIQRIRLTSSCKTNADILTATGNSAELNIELNVKPIFGIPEAKHKGGITVPKTANINPHLSKLPPKAPLKRKVGGSTTKIKIQAPVIIKALFCSGGYSLPKLPFSIKKIA